MRPSHLIAMLTIFALGIAVGAQGRKNDRVSSDMFRGKSPDQAAATLLEKAAQQADDGTWERIAVARVHYLSGDKARAESIFDGITKKDASDWIRIGRVYWKGDDWDQAKEAFAKVLEAKPKDEDWLAEIGAYYNLKGDRETAEELFERSFKEDPDNLYNTLKVAGSYLGVDVR